MIDENFSVATKQVLVPNHGLFIHINFDDINFDDFNFDDFHFDNFNLINNLI